MSATVIRMRRLGVAVRVHPRVPVAVLVLLLLTLAAAIGALTLGELGLSPLEVLLALVGSGDQVSTFAVHDLRLPRIVSALTIGIGLGVAGAVLQGLTRNPLAAPEIIGVTAGANAVLVVVVVAVPDLPFAVLPFITFAGALVTMVAVYLLAWRGGSSPIRLILVGIGITLVGQSVVAGIVAQQPAFRLTSVIASLAGSVYARGWSDILPVAIWLLVLIPVVLALARQLDVMQLGDDAAGNLGLHVERTRLVLLLASVAIAAACVAIAGPVGFVGLLAPHIARMLVGNSHVGVLLTSALTGGLMVLLADTLGRTLFAPIQVPVGVVTAIIGVPYFLYLLVRSQSMELGR